MVRSKRSRSTSNRSSKRRKTTSQKADKALRLVKRVVNSQEVKHFDTTLSGTAGWLGFLEPINAYDQIVKGTADNQRIGDKITIIGVQYSFYFS